MQKILVFIATLLASISCSEQANKLNVMTFNIRNSAANDGENNWEHRKELAARVILESQADIVGLQEALPDQIRDMESLLPGYSWYGVGRQNGKSSGEHCPVFYRTDRFELLESGDFWLSETPEIPGSKNWGSLSRIVTYVKFRVRQTQSEFWVFNTHFDHKSQKARLRAALILLEKATKIATGLPIVVTGDFNFTDENEAYQTLTGNWKDCINLWDAENVSQKQPEGGKMTYNGFGQAKKDSKIDFIFVNHLFDVQSHRVLPVKEANLYVSDHYPVISEIEIADSLEYEKQAEPSLLPRVAFMPYFDAKAQIFQDKKALEIKTFTPGAEIRVCPAWAITTGWKSRSD